MKRNTTCSTDFEKMKAELLKTFSAKAAYKEAQLRRFLGNALDTARKQKHWGVKRLAKKLGLSENKTNQLLFHERGMQLSTLELMKAIEALNMCIFIVMSSATFTHSFTSNTDAKELV